MELLSGFFLIEARDLDEADEMTKIHPAARTGEHRGEVEIRRIETIEAPPEP